MNVPPWLRETWNELVTALATKRLHHALLFAAPAGFGKRAIADALIGAALCTQRMADGHACGACRACALVAAGSHPDRARIGLEMRDNGKLRTEITVDQIRALAQRLSLSSQFGGWQIAQIDPADRMNVNAANALLKTLEEPATATVIILIADESSRLPATIRSRCQRVAIPAPDRNEALAWLGKHNLDAGTAAAALEASLGNPGQALAWTGDGTLDLRGECRADLAALAWRRHSVLEVADRWAADRPETRLWFAAALARDEACTLASGNRGTLGLTAREEIPKLAQWSGRANRARGLLATSLRIDLLVLDLLRAWPTTEAGQGRS